MKLVAGLGNPGETYRGTRHNVGFEVVDAVVARHGLSWRRGAGSAGRDAAQESRWRRPGESQGDVLLLKPQTFMNLSGLAVADALRFYKIELSDLLVVCDDVALPLGRLRARAGGGEGGHNGLRSVAEQLGTIDYPRLRVGVGRGDERRDLADHVLARFDPDEAGGIGAAIVRAAEAVETWVDGGLSKMMNSFNRVEEGP